MNEIEEAIKEVIRQEIKMAEVPNKIEINENTLNGALGITLQDQLEAIKMQAVSEYYLAMGNYNKAILYLKKYHKILKELL
jgi:prephenate dehydratase